MSVPVAVSSRTRGSSVEPSGDTVTVSRPLPGSVTWRRSASAAVASVPANAVRSGTGCGASESGTVSFDGNVTANRNPSMPGPRLASSVGSASFGEGVPSAAGWLTPSRRNPPAASVSGSTARVTVWRNVRPAAIDGIGTTAAGTSSENPPASGPNRPSADRTSRAFDGSDGRLPRLVTASETDTVNPVPTGVGSPASRRAVGARSAAGGARPDGLS
jgi:hypothetical protein